MFISTLNAAKCANISAAKYAIIYAIINPIAYIAYDLI